MAKPRLTGVFEQGLDLHTITAAAISGKRVEEIDADGEDRDNAKRVNFGAAYGMGADALVQAAWESYGRVILLRDAQNWLRTFKLAYPQFAAWCRIHAETCKARGYIIIGRDAKRGIGRIFRFAWNKKVDQKKYTQSCNLPIQGQCADAAMLAFIRVVHLLKEAGIPGGPVLWLHDEIVLEVPIEFAEQARLLLDQAMTTAFAEVFPGAPLRGLVAARIGDTWAATKKKG